MLIGIDTGGTYTDAVRYHEVDGVVATAKARTRLDLSIGIAEALDRVIDDPAEVSLVSLSTTLATNALVEGIGGEAALVFIGFGEAELDRGGLRSALGDAPLIVVDGGHDPLGNELAPLDAEAVLAAARELEAERHIDAYAVAAQFSVRNPAHELAAREALVVLGKPVACSHELSARLNGPRRALTCVLNARLIGLVAELRSAAETILAERGIDAPLMLVRGDGSLVSAEFAEQRPIETILSGPAASLIGAAHLTATAGRGSADGHGPPRDLIVGDIGGTTTDIGVLRGGVPTLRDEGVTVGGHQTMVEAVAMVTHGLGADSEVAIDGRSRPAALRLGPRRMIPLSLLAVDEPDLVHRTLDDRRFPYRDHDTRFARATGRPGRLSDHEAKLLAAIGTGWAPLDAIASSSRAAAMVQGLVSRGLVRLAGFTPSDAAHVLGLHAAWDTDAAGKAAALMATAADAAGEPVRPDGPSLARWVVETLIRRSAEAVLAAALDHDGLPGSEVDSTLVQQALDGHVGAADVRIGVSLPVVGVGASAGTYYPAVADVLGSEGIVPDHAEVANAVGAAVAQIRIVGTATITQPSKGRYRIHLPEVDDTADLQPALDAAIETLERRVRDQARQAGAAEVALSTETTTKTAAVGGKELFVEATVTMTGVGRPRRAARAESSR